MQFLEVSKVRSLLYGYGGGRSIFREARETIHALDQAKRLLFALAFAAAYLPLVVFEFVLGHWSRQSDAHVSRGSPTTSLLIHFRCRAASHQDVWTKDSQPEALPDRYAAAMLVGAVVLGRGWRFITDWSPPHLDYAPPTERHKRCRRLSDGFS